MEDQNKKHFEVEEGDNYYWISVYYNQNEIFPNIKIRLVDCNFDERDLYQYYDYSYTFEELKEQYNNFFCDCNTLRECFNALVSHLGNICLFNLKKINKLIVNSRMKCKGGKEINILLTKERPENKEILNFLWQKFQKQETILNLYKSKCDDLENKLIEISTELKKQSLNPNAKCSFYNLDNNTIHNSIIGMKAPSCIKKTDLMNSKKYYEDNPKNVCISGSLYSINANLNTIPAERGGLSCQSNPPTSNKLEVSNNSELNQNNCAENKKNILYKDNDANIIFNTDPKNFEKSKVIVTDCKKFTAFNNYRAEQILVYTDSNNNLNIFNLCNEKIINSFREAFDNNIVNCCRYYRDIKSQRDLVLTSSSDWVKVWDIESKENNPKYSLFLSEVNSICLLSHESLNKNYLMTSSNSVTISDTIELWDLENLNDNNNIINNEFSQNNPKPDKEIKTNSEVSFVDTFFASSGGVYLINGNNGSINSYIFDQQGILEKPFKTFQKKKLKKEAFFNVLITEENSNTKIIGSTIRKIVIWDFYGEREIAEIDGSFDSNYGISHKFRDLCLWNHSYLLVCCKEEILIVNINNTKEVWKLNGGEDCNLRIIRKLRSSKDGECFLVSDSSDSNERSISLWLSKEPTNSFCLNNTEDFIIN